MWHYRGMDSLDGKVFWGVIGTVLGVVLGFFLNVAYASFVRRKHISNLKTALKDECKSLLCQLPLLIDIFEQCIDNLKQGKILPGAAVHSLSTVYSSAIAELYPYLKLKDRNLLHVVYERLRVGDEILENYESNLSREIKENLIGNPIQGWISRMTEQIGSYKVINDLIKSYLDGNPKDVFYIDRLDKERK
jgi:hypothetical protein